MKSVMASNNGVMAYQYRKAAKIKAMAAINGVSININGENNGVMIISSA